MVQDDVEYNRHCELMKSFKSKDVNEMDDIESSANPSYDYDYHKYANGIDNFLQINATGDGTNYYPAGDHNEYGRVDFRHTRHSLSGIPGANGKVRLGHKPCCGLLESNYYLPLRFAPLELEFTVVSDGTEPVVVPQGNGTTQTDKNGYYFQDGTTSTSWELNNVIIRTGVITLDNTVDNNITKHLLEGQSLKLIVPQYHTITQTFNTGGGEIKMNIVKSAFKLTNAFVSLYRQPRGGEVYANYLVDKYVYKRWNYFYDPMINGQINDGGDPENIPAQAGKGFADSSPALAYQLQVQSRKFPEFEVQSLSEPFYFLRRTLHFMNADQNSVNISYQQFRKSKYVMAFYFQKMADGSFTGIITKMGSLITFKVRGNEGSLETEQIQEVFVNLIVRSLFWKSANPVRSCMTKNYFLNKYIYIYVPSLQEERNINQLETANE